MYSEVEEGTQSFAELIEEAKRDLNKDLQVVERKKRISEGSGSADEDEDEAEAEENEEAESSDESGEDKGWFEYLLLHPLSPSRVCFPAPKYSTVFSCYLLSFLPFSEIVESVMFTKVLLLLLTVKKKCAR